MRKITILLLIIVSLIFLSFSDSKFRVPNGFGKVGLSADQRVAIEKIYDAIYTVEIRKEIADFELMKKKLDKKKILWRAEYLKKAWTILTENQKSLVPERYRLE